MKTMFETFKKSVFSPQFYREVGGGSFKDALRYYAKFGLALSLLSVIAFGLLLVPQGVGFLRERAPELVKEYYPAGLVLNIVNGELSVNVPLPYIIATKDITRRAIQNWKFDNVIVIDTQNDFNKKTFDEYNTFALVTKHEIVTSNNGGNVTIQEIPSTMTTMINQTAVLSWVEKVRASLVYVVPIGLLILFVTLFFGFILYLIPLFVLALIPFLLARLKKIQLSYGGAYRMSLYAVIPGIVLKSILNISGVFFVPAYLTFLIFLLIIVMNVRESEQPKLFEN